MSELPQDERLDKHHLRQGVKKLIDDPQLRAQVMALVERYVATSESNQDELVAGIRQLRDQHPEAERQADHLLQQFERSYFKLAPQKPSVVG